jgi:hypothetical protein
MTIPFLNWLRTSNCKQLIGKYTSPELDPDPDLAVKIPDPDTGSGSGKKVWIQLNPGSGSPTLGPTEVTLPQL